MAETNPNARLEAFCDAVFAIALTLLIIDIKIPSSVKINSTYEFWLALKEMIPSVLAFLLSFIIILITWVNHHGSLKLVNKLSSSFMFANGFMLLTVVFIPFPTSLVGKYLFTGYSSPAVVLYVSTMAVQAIAWILFTGVIIKNQLAKDEKSRLIIKKNRTYGYFAFIIYSVCAVTAFWFPLVIAVITTCLWLYWLVLAVRIKHE
jgi:uncharacterized membrane protein